MILVQFELFPFKLFHCGIYSTMEHSNSSFSFNMKKTIVVNYCQLLYIPFQFIFPDQEQFHEEVGCYHPDGNPA